MTKRISPRSAIFTVLWLATLSACGGQKAEPPPQAPQAQLVCPPQPSPCPAPPEVDPVLSLEQLLAQADIKAKANEMAAKLQIKEKLGQKEISPEEFGKFATLAWAVDPALRVAYFRALDRTNQLIDLVKPADGGKFDPLAVPADPEQDISFRISEVIVNWALVQRMIVNDLRALGVENVSAIRADDDFSPAEPMMRDLLPLVAPPPEPAPLPAALSFFLPDAFAQTQKTVKGGKLPPKIPAKAMVLVKTMPRIKVAQAPLLLARTLSFKVGGAAYVLESPLQVAAPEFRAVPVDQFQFKLEKKFVGDAYFNELSAAVTQLANVPQRSQVQWREMAYGLTELKLVLNNLNPNYGEPPPSPSPQPVPAAPSTPAQPTAPTPPTAGTNPEPAPGTATRPDPGPSGAAPATGSATRPDTAPSGAAPVLPPARPESGFGPQPSAPTTGTERPSTGTAPSLPSSSAPAPQAPPPAPAAPAGSLPPLTNP